MPNGALVNAIDHALSPPVAMVWAAPVTPARGRAAIRARR